MVWGDKGQEVGPAFGPVQGGIWVVDFNVDWKDDPD